MSELYKVESEVVKREKQLFTEYMIHRFRTAIASEIAHPEQMTTALAEYYQLRCLQKTRCPQGETESEYEEAKKYLEKIMRIFGVTIAGTSA